MRLPGRAPAADPGRAELGVRLAAALAAYDAPLATPLLVVDLDAVDANAADLERRAGGTPIRVASKSVRVPALLRRVLARDGFAGVLAYTLAEALWLVADGVSDDVLVAYPTVDRIALRDLLETPGAAERVTLMVDSAEHLDLVDAIREGAAAATAVRVALDVDAGLLVAGQHVGPKRSPLRTVEQVVRLAEAVAARPGFTLVGLMTYEGQVAGVPDTVPGLVPAARSVVVRRIKQASLRQLAERRAAIAAGLRHLELPLWNAGGSGSVAETAADPVVTEIAAGSGLLVPTLFDHYASFTPRPAAYFALPVTRRPSADTVTVHGGGLVASGAAGADRLPTPWLPEGLRLTPLEGAGEVQTPLVGPGAADLGIGDLVWFRHAKSGELFEHARCVRLLAGAGTAARFVDEVPTYRGLGLAF